MTKTPNTTSQPNYPDQIISDKPQPGAEHAALFAADLRRMEQEARELPGPSPTAGMNLGQRILHVGGRENGAGYIEFGSVAAVRALVGQVLRDLQPTHPQQSAEPAALADVSKEQYARMFGAACDALGQISDHLGIDSNLDPGAEPIIEAIDELRAAALQAAPPAPAAVPVLTDIEAFLAAVRTLPTVRTTEFDGEEADGTPKSWRNRPFVSLRALERLVRERAAAPAQAYSIDADPQGIRAYVADAITGALACGAQGGGTPPPGHWLTPFWQQARFGQIQYNALRDATDALLNAPGAAQEHATQLAGQRRDLEVTDEMALSFHRAISDGAIGQDDVDDIKDGLRAAFCNIAAPAQAQEDARDAALPGWWPEFIQSVAELPDRNSPEDEPDAMVATADELGTCAINAIDAARAAQGGAA